MAARPLPGATGVLERPGGGCGHAVGLNAGTLSLATGLACCGAQPVAVVGGRGVSVVLPCQDSRLPRMSGLRCPRSRPWPVPRGSWCHPGSQQAAARLGGAVTSGKAQVPGASACGSLPAARRRWAAAGLVVLSGRPRCDRHLPVELCSPALLRQVCVVAVGWLDGCGRASRGGALWRLQRFRPQRGQTRSPPSLRRLGWRPGRGAAAGATARARQGGQAQGRLRGPEGRAVASGRSSPDRGAPAARSPRRRGSAGGVRPRSARSPAGHCRRGSGR